MGLKISNRKGFTRFKFKSRMFESWLKQLIPKWPKRSKKKLL